MKADIPVVPDELLEQRRRTGADQWDELWDGVLHMSPMPSPEHQELEYQLEDHGSDGTGDGIRAVACCIW